MGSKTRLSTSLTAPSDVKHPANLVMPPPPPTHTHGSYKLNKISFMTFSVSKLLLGNPTHNLIK